MTFPRIDMGVSIVYARDLSTGVAHDRKIAGFRRQRPRDNRINGTFSSMPKDNSRCSAAGST